MKKNKILFICLFIGLSFYLTSSIQAQCKGWFWISNFGGDSSDDVESICVDNSDHSSYIAGSFTNDTILFLTDTIINIGLRNAFILKYDSLGNVLWAESSGGDDRDLIQDLSLDSSGNIYCLGSYESDTMIVGNDTLINNGVMNFFITKYSCDGHVLWSLNGGGGGMDFSQSISCDISNKLYAVGAYESQEIILGSDTLINNGSTDAFITNFNDTGDIVWAKSIGGIDIDFAETVATDNFGFIYVAGVFQSDSLYIGTQLLLNKGAYDIFISKLDSYGNIIWAKGFGGNSFDRLQGLAPDKYGNIYISGQFMSDSIEFDNYTFINQGITDIYYAKLDNSGNVLWAKGVGNTSQNIFSNIVVSSTNEVYISGCFRGQFLMLDSILLMGNSYQDGFIAELDTNGMSIWAKTIGDGWIYNYLEDITIDEAGDIYLTGEYSGPYILFGLDTILNTDVTGILSDIYSLKLIYYPNPQTPQITQIDDTLISDLAHKYQWYFDKNYILQAVHQKYIVTKTGNYFVEITDTNGCSACSDELYVLFTRLEEKYFPDGNTYIFPNPFNNYALLKIDPVHEQPFDLKIFSSDGKLIRNYSQVYSNEVMIKKGNLQPGLYYYWLSNKHGTIQTSKILIQ